MHCIVRPYQPTTRARGLIREGEREGGIHGAQYEEQGCVVSYSSNFGAELNGRSDGVLESLERGKERGGKGTERWTNSARGVYLVRYLSLGRYGVRLTVYRGYQMFLEGKGVVLVLVQSRFVCAFIVRVVFCTD